MSVQWFSKAHTLIAHKCTVVNVDRGLFYHLYYIHTESFPGTYSSCCQDHTLPHLVALGCGIERPAGSPYIIVTQWIANHLQQETAQKHYKNSSINMFNQVFLLSDCCMNTWADDVHISPHAGRRVSDSRHVRVQLHCTQRVLRCASIHSTIMIQVTLQMKKNKPPEKGVV